MTPKRVILTGASGFVGQHCIAPLLARGFEVHAVSSRDALRKGANVHWHRADLLNIADSTALVADVGATHLLHLAWYVVPGKLITSPENFAWTAASFGLVRAFAEQGGRRFVGCGSAYEYDWNYGYCAEERTPAVPNTVYGACKQALNLMTRAYADQVGLSASWARAFFLYGPCEQGDRLVASVIRSILGGRSARCSHGRQIRDYLHVQDVANGLVAVLDSDMRGTVNVCSGQATTLREIVLTVGRLLNRPELVELGAIPARANDAALVVGDNSRLVAETGWAPQVDLEAGLRQTIDWWRVQETAGAA
jgi:nucleoside-diphosphate-sugar epimerase